MIMPVQQNNILLHFWLESHGKRALCIAVRWHPTKQYSKNFLVLLTIFQCYLLLHTQQKILCE